MDTQEFQKKGNNYGTLCQASQKVCHEHPFFIGITCGDSCEQYSHPLSPFHIHYFAMPWLNLLYLKNKCVNVSLAESRSYSPSSNKLQSLMDIKRTNVFSSSKIICWPYFCILKRLYLECKNVQLVTWVRWQSYQRCCKSGTRLDWAYMYTVRQENRKVNIKF